MLKNNRKFLANQVLKPAYFDVSSCTPAVQTLPLMPESSRL